MSAHDAANKVQLQGGPAEQRTMDLIEQLMSYDTSDPLALNARIEWCVYLPVTGLVSAGANVRADLNGAQPRSHSCFVCPAAS
jgi:hypothetical protein